MAEEDLTQPPPPYHAEEPSEVDDEALANQKGAVSPRTRIKAVQDDEEVDVEEKDGTVFTIVIKELTPEDNALWMKILAKRRPSDRRDKVRKSNFAGLHEDMIHLAGRDKSGKRVPRDRITKWGTNAKNFLFAKCLDKNGMTQRAEDEEGKG